MGSVASSIGSIGRSVFGLGVDILKSPLTIAGGVLGALGGQRGGGDNGFGQYQAELDRQSRIQADQQKRTAAERERLQREESDRKRGGRMRGRRSLLNQGDEVGVKLRSTLG